MAPVTLTAQPQRERRRSRSGVPRRAVFYPCCCEATSQRFSGGRDGHDMVGKAELTRELAALLGVEFAGDYEPGPAAGGALYFVPSTTLVGLAEARRLGIRGPLDLFGGVVPSPFVATKVITHPLVRPDAAAPRGWSAAFAQDVQHAVLPGYSVFSPADALEAGLRLLAEGPVRLKRADGVGGLGQWVVADAKELAEGIAGIEVDELVRQGLVLERNLASLETYSVGQAQVGWMVASYHGTQRLTRNHRGDEVYGGSDLVVVRGGFDELLAMPLQPEIRAATEQALTYHHAALRHFKGMFASRYNYDVVHGVDANGRPHAGVLEQSWRIGGASVAEIAALRAFRADPSLACVRASSHEIHGDNGEVPDGAMVYFDGVDPVVGRLRKYALVEPYADA
jgi:hypothetical protein